MKVRESDLPKEELWTTYFNPQNILKQFGLSRKTKDVADFGCGYGTFTIPAAQIISGKIYALDIEIEMIQAVNAKAKDLNLENIEPIQRDFVSQGSGLKDSSLDFVMLFNILHLEKPTDLLKEAHRILKPRGKVGIIHWNYDPTTPSGPPIEIRPKQSKAENWPNRLDSSLKSNLT